MNCEKCGTETPENKTLCEKCLTDANEDDQVIEIKEEESENDTVFDTEFPSEEKTDVKNTVNFRNSILPLAGLALISIVIIMIVMFVKGLLSTDSPNATLEKCIVASYNFDIDEYAKYSTINATCRQKLGDTDYDFDETYATQSQVFSEVKSYINETFGFYDVDVKILGNTIFKKGSKEFSEYLTEFVDFCKDDTYVEAFAESEIEIDVEYAFDEEVFNESSNESVYSILVDGTWYFLAE